MKKNKVLVFTRILYTLFAIGTIMSLFIVYKDIDNDFAFKFVVGYVFLTFFFIICILFITILNLGKLKWTDMRKRISRFIISFVTLVALSYGFDYLFRPTKIDLYRVFSNALGLAFGISFIDVIFFNNQDN